MNVSDPVQDQLAWEKARRRKAAIAAVVGGVLAIGPSIYLNYATSGSEPETGVLEALTPALSGQVEPAINPRTSIAEFYSDHATALVISGLLSAIGVLAMGYVLMYLFRATRARRLQVPSFARWAIVIAVVMMAISGPVLPLYQSILANGYLDAADRSREAIDAALTGNGLIVLVTLGYAGSLALALAFVLVSLNAMRAGLLTRFMGYMGMIVGALYVLPVGALPVVQAFWLIALAALFLGQWPNGTPPAWASGKEEPWLPSARSQPGARKRGQPPPDTPETGDVEQLSEDAADPRPAPARPSSNARKKRKRR